MARFRPVIPDFVNPKTGRDYTYVTDEMRMAYLNTELRLSRKLVDSLKGRIKGLQRQIATSDQLTESLQRLLEQEETVTERLHELMEDGDHDAVAAALTRSVEHRRALQRVLH